MAVSGFVSKDKVMNPHNLDMTLNLNGKEAQHENTGHMIHKVPDLLSYLTQYMTLNAGDLILTGTPSGIGAVKSGDFVTASMKQGQTELASIFMKIEQSSI